MKAVMCIQILRVNLVKLILMFSMLSGCADMKTYPDTCKNDTGCELESPLGHQASTLNINEEKTVEICGCKPWINSGITVAENQVYSFSYPGYAKGWCDGNKKGLDPSLGWNGFWGWLFSPFKRSDKADWYALIGAIGKDDQKTFKVLSYNGVNKVTMHGSGTLYFYANDAYGYYYNNKGHFTLTIKRLDDIKKS